MKLEIDTKYISDVRVITHLVDLAGKRLRFYDHGWADCVHVLVEQPGVYLAYEPFKPANFQENLILTTSFDNWFDLGIKKLKEVTNSDSKRFLVDYVNLRIVWDFSTGTPMTWFSYIPPAKISSAIIAYDAGTKILYRFADGIGLENFAMAQELVRINCLVPKDKILEMEGTEFATRLAIAEMNRSFPKLNYFPDYTQYVRPGLETSDLRPENLVTMRKLFGE